VLVLVRHGESVWNAADRFAGWADIALTPAGREEARSAGRRLRAEGVLPSTVHTSLLARGWGTTLLLLEALGAPDLPILATELLNELHYGALQGMRRTAAAERYGAAQVAAWRRGIEDRPPVDAVGRAESLADVRRRLEPYVEGALVPALDAGHTVLVVSHGNTLRMLAQALEGLSDEEATAWEIPTGGVRVTHWRPVS
jgi:2,3-bisphosphoglycerate-dependent phosphoglycerate mutase